MLQTNPVNQLNAGGSLMSQVIRMTECLESSDLLTCLLISFALLFNRGLAPIARAGSADVASRNWVTSNAPRCFLGCGRRFCS